METIFLNIQMDCEATQKSIADPQLGMRAVQGLREILREQQLRATFAVIPGDMRLHGSMYRELEDSGHEVALHLHPAEQGHGEFLGTCAYDEQVTLLQAGLEVFQTHLGHLPQGFTPGYFSANDHTFPALYAVGLRHGAVSCPTRDLPQCACVWGNSPPGAHYAHRYNRCLAGDLDFVDIPVTNDPDSRMWGGAHPQDLRVELVDAKNHYYTMEKAIRRQLNSDVHVQMKYLKILTHNIFDYSDEHDFRRHTLLGMVSGARRICEGLGVELVPATSARMAAAYRQAVPLPQGTAALELDTRGR